MRKSAVIIFSVFIAFSVGCGLSGDKKDELKEELREELKAEQEKAAETSTNESENQSKATPDNQESAEATSAKSEVEPLEPGTYRIKAKLSKVVSDEDETFFVFENVYGDAFHFYTGRDTKGLDFADEFEPNRTPPGYDDIWFDVVFELGDKRYYHSGARREMTRTVFVALDVSKTDTPPETGGDVPAFTATNLELASFSGVEPFWGIVFRESHIKKSSPSGEVKLYYLKNGQMGNHELADVIQPISPDAVQIEATDESGGAMAVITITRERCSDGMSDNNYPYSISFTWEDGGRLTGCGSLYD
jgi:uncharacterized membrane protein